MRPTATNRRRRKGTIAPIAASFAVGASAPQLLFKTIGRLVYRFKNGVLPLGSVGVFTRVQIAIQ
jgi:hypothetical protein